AFALTLVSAVMITNDLVPARLRATGQALMKAVLFGLAPIIGASGGGLVYGTIGARAMFLSSTVVVGAAGILALVAAPSRERRTTVIEPSASAAGASQ
ncbi:MAG TPA: MFS transporter, partial [Candidatus Dormibacteraeota bacterium]|nr:MFS transporter [Candidatus Dormibacteraeota bacterium]